MESCLGLVGKQLPLESSSLPKHMTELLDTVQLSKVIKLSHLSTFLQPEEAVWWAGLGEHLDANLPGGNRCG